MTYEHRWNILNNCHCFYTSATLGLKMLHQKVCKFTTKLLCNKKCVNHHRRAKIHICFEKFVYFAHYGLLNQRECVRSGSVLKFRKDMYMYNSSKYTR